MKTFVSIRLDTDVNVGGLSARARLPVHVSVQKGSADAPLLCSAEGQRRSHFTSVFVWENNGEINSKILLKKITV